MSIDPYIIYIGWGTIDTIDKIQMTPAEAISIDQSPNATGWPIPGDLHHMRTRIHEMLCQGAADLVGISVFFTGFAGLPEMDQ